MMEMGLLCIKMIDGRELMDEFVEMLCNQLAECFTSFDPEDFLDEDFRTW